MKLLKVLTIVLFSLFLSFSVSFAQENSTENAGVNNPQQNINPGNISIVETEKTVSTETESEADKTVSDAANKKKPSITENDGEKHKAGSKKNIGIKTAPASIEVNEDSSNQVKMEGDLLLINEGNFRYNRIPDIKLIDIKPEIADSGNQAVEVSVDEQNSSTGLLGLSKTASDVIVKGGVLLLILLIFVLYKSRMSGPGNKSSKRRNVLNSYRK